MCISVVSASTSDAEEPECASSADRVASVLRTEILKGRLRPGERLKDAHLSAQFAVSRNTMRDALRELASSGLVTTRRNAGSTVRRLVEGDVRDIYRVRRVIESQAVLGSSSAGSDQFDIIAKAIDDTTMAVVDGRWNDVGTSSLYFHQALVDMIGSARLSALFENILAELRLVFSVMTDESAFQLQWVDRDREIAMHVFAGRRLEANEALNPYLEDSEALVIDAIRQSRSDNDTVPAKRKG